MISSNHWQSSNMTIRLKALTIVAIPVMFLTGIGGAFGQAFDHIRIGDADGFGFTKTEDLKRSADTGSTGPADVNGNGVLEPDEFLPDLNGDGRVWLYGTDHFDNRWDGERENQAIECVGCSAISTATRGSNWTDLSLTPTWVAKDWPDLNGPALPNFPTFVFDFIVDDDAIVEGSSVFFNLVAADFDYDLALIQVRFANGNRQLLTLRSPGGVILDGLIQESTATFAFDDVFTADPNGNWRGLVKVTVASRFEPYNAVDYAELSMFAAVAALPAPRPRFALATPTIVRSPSFRSPGFRSPGSL
jgi:hypothetical protein